MPEFDVQEISYSNDLKVDKEKGIIRNVKILGRTSKNGRDYTKKALISGKDLYEGIVLYYDHPDPKDATVQRSLQESVGYARNTRVEDDGIYGDAHILKTHPHGPALLERAERFPDLFGISQNARVSGRRDGGGRIVVESIRKVRSLDFVRSPASNLNLFESEGTMAQPLLEVIKGLPDSPEKTLALAFHSEYANVLEEAEVEVKDEMSSDQKMAAAFELMIVSAFRDSNLDTAAKLKKFRDILKAQEKLVESKETTPTSPTPTPEGEGDGVKLAETTESINALESRIDRYENKDKIMALAKKKKVVIDENTMEMCLELPEKHWKELISKLQPVIELPEKKRPTFTGSVLEETKLPAAAKDSEEMVKRMRRR